MDTLSAFAMGRACKGRALQVFDWTKAAEIIRDEKPANVSAGLDGDWEHTGGDIYREGKIVEDDYTYLSSTWATPQICVDGQYRDCFVMESETKWSSSTKWPDEAKAILADQAA